MTDFCHIVNAKEYILMKYWTLDSCTVVCLGFSRTDTRGMENLGLSRSGYMSPLVLVVLILRMSRGKFKYGISIWEARYVFFSFRSCSKHKHLPRTHCGCGQWSIRPKLTPSMQDGFCPDRSPQRDLPLCPMESP